jgi:tetratricopeptide (TPR) repeat protein
MPMARKLFEGLWVIALLAATELRAQSGYSNRQANAFYANHDAAGALRYATAWSAAEPNNPEAWAAVGTAYGAGLHQPQSAIAAFQHALKLKPEWPACFNALGDEYMNLKNYPEAVTWFRRAAEAAETHSIYWNNLAAALGAMNRRDEALRALNDSEAHGAPRGSQDWYVLGNGYYKLLDYPRAAHAYEQSVLLNPTGQRAWTNLGCTQQQQGQWDQALQSYQRAMRLGDPLGKQNYATLQSGIAEEQRHQQAASTGNSVSRAIAAFRADWNANHRASWSP